MEETKQVSLRSLFLLRPGVVFLNHGSFGACPRPVFEAYQSWQLELERQPVEFLGRRVQDLLGEARAALGKFVGVRPDDLVYVPNATIGLNTVARSLPLAAGDQVLTTDHEYGAMERTWQFICRRRGAQLVRQPLHLPLTDPDQVVKSIWAGVTPSTRVLFLSHITSPTAVLLPIVPLIRRAREAGILTVIDGAHAPGQISLDLESLGADFYVGHCHKWMMAPKGAAFLYARREVQPLLEPLVVSWGWESEQPGPSSLVDHHEWQGTRDIAAFLSVPAAIDFMQRHDWAQVRQRCHHLLLYARQSIAALTGLPPITPDGSAWFVQMSVLPLPPCDAATLKQRLYDEFSIEVPVYSWNNRVFLRISVQGYNQRGDIDALVEALRQLLAASSGDPALAD